MALKYPFAYSLPPVAQALAILISAGSAAQSAEIAWKLNEETAQSLAAAATGHSRTPEALDYQGTDTDPLFFVFYGPNPPPAMGGFGYFAVNPWTGDVWDLWGCYKLSTPALRKSQAEIRRGFTHEELKQYRRLVRLKPDCI